MVKYTDFKLKEDSLFLFTLQMVQRTQMPKICYFIYCLWLIFWVSSGYFHHLASLHHGTHKAFTVSLKKDLVPPSGLHLRSGVCMDLSSFSADLLQVILGLPRCLFPSGVQNKPLARSLGYFRNTWTFCNKLLKPFPR